MLALIFIYFLGVNFNAVCLMVYVYGFMFMGLCFVFGVLAYDWLSRVWCKWVRTGLGR